MRGFFCLVLLAGLGLLLWIAGSGHEEDVRATGETGSERRSATEPRPGLEGRAQENGPSSIPERQDAPELREGSAVAGARRELRGTVVVTDAEGTKHTQVDGSFIADVRVGDATLAVPVPVRGGAWSIDFAEVGVMHVRDLKLGDRMACATREAIPVVAGAPVTLEAWWPRPSVLRVFDVETRKPLLGLHLVLADRFADPRMHPSEGWERRVRTTEGASPLQLPDVDGTATWFVRSAGYAWQRVAVDHRVGGSHEVGLTPSGDVRFNLAGNLPHPGTWLVLWRDMGEPEPSRAAEIRLRASDAVTLQGLRPGAYRATLSLGRRGKAWLNKSFAIEGRSMTETTLDLSTQPAALQELVPLRGTLRSTMRPLPVSLTLTLIPVEPADRDRVVRIPTHKLQAVEDAPGVLSWDAGRVAAGTWRVRVDPIGLAQEVVVRRGEGARVDIDIPALHRLYVRAVDAHSEQPLTDASIVLQVIGPNRGGQRSLRFMPKERAWSAWVPAGNARLLASDPRYRDARIDLVVDGTTGPVRVGLERAEGVILSFVREDAQVPIDSAPDCWLVDAQGHRHTDLYYDRERQRIFQRAPGPGRFELHVAAGRNTKEVPIQTFELKEREFREHTVRLQAED